MPSFRAGAAQASGPGSSDALAAALSEVHRGIEGATPDLAVLFIGAGHAQDASGLAAMVRERLGPRHLLGVTAGAVLANAEEVERPDALALWAACLPGAALTPLRYAPPLEESSVVPGPGWPEPPDADALVLFADPFTFPADGFLGWARQARPGMAVCGGLASAASRPGGNALILDGQVLDTGAVGVAIAGVRARTLVSQGCRPVGEPFVVTRAEGNLVEELAGAPAVERIREVYTGAPQAEQELMRAGLHMGIVIDEYREVFSRGDFLVRGVLGAHPDTGAVAVGDRVEVGQAVQFHVRDAHSADEDLRELLDGLVADGAASPGAGLLFTCNGRGEHLFGVANHDAGLVREALGPVPLAGFFAAGEFGPVGGRSFVHGFTASLLLLQPGQARGEGPGGGPDGGPDRPEM